MNERRFRIMDGAPSVPWRLVEPYEAQALANHDQTLEQLSERGGLSAGELWCIVHGKHWREQPDEKIAREWLGAWLAADVVEQIAAWIERPEARHAGTEALAARIRSGEWQR